jgi:hypothetical protein
VKQKEERDLENALAWDEKPGNMEAALEAMRLDLFQEAGQTLVCGENPTLLFHRNKRINANLVKHWFVYEYPEEEVRLLESNQNIDGEQYSFVDGKDSLVFSYK